MTIDEIYQLILFIADKEQKGKAFTEDQYNLVLKDSVWVVVNNELKKIFMGEYTPAKEDILEMSPLRVMKKNSELTGVKVPDDYIRWTAVQADFGSGYIPVAVLSERQSNDNSNDVYYLADVRPYCNIENVTVNMTPNDPKKVKMFYIRKPLIPFRDYCVSSLLDTVFMPATSYLTPSPVQDVYNLNIDIHAVGGDYTQLIVANVTKDGADWSVNPSYTSKTIETELPEDSHEQLLMAILSKVGINLSADQVEAYAEQKGKEQ
jgi:hypothetical protein